MGSSPSLDSSFSLENLGVMYLFVVHLSCVAVSMHVILQCQKTGLKDYTIGL